MKLLVFLKKAVVSLLLMLTFFATQSAFCAMDEGLLSENQCVEYRNLVNEVITSCGGAQAKAQFYESLKSLLYMDSALYEEINADMKSRLDEINWDITKLELDGDEFSKLSVRTEGIVEELLPLERGGSDLSTMIKLKDIRRSFDSFRSVLEGLFLEGVSGFVRSRYEPNAPWVYSPKNYHEALGALRDIYTQFHANIVGTFLGDVGQSGFYDLMSSFYRNPEMLDLFDSLSPQDQQNGLRLLRALDNKAKTAFSFAQRLAELGQYVSWQEPLPYPAYWNRSCLLVRNVCAGLLAVSVAAGEGATAGAAVGTAVGPQGAAAGATFGAGAYAAGAAVGAVSSIILDWSRVNGIDAKFVHLEEQMVFLRLAIAAFNTSVAYSSEYARVLNSLLKKATKAKNDALVRRLEERQRDASIQRSKDAVIHQLQRKHDRDFRRIVEGRHEQYEQDREATAVAFAEQQRKLKSQELNFERLVDYLNTVARNCGVPELEGIGDQLLLEGANPHERHGFVMVDQPHRR